MRLNTPEEWLHAHILTEGRGVPCEVLGGVGGRDGDWLVRERAPREMSTAILVRCFGSTKQETSGLRYSATAQLAFSCTVAQPKRTIHNRFCSCEFFKERYCHYIFLG